MEILSAAHNIPRSFVYLKDVDPSILQDMRYATANNFTGRKLPGYNAPECILLRPVAEALKKVQASLKPKQLSLKVYDCYRPQRAVSAFMAWARGEFGTNNRHRYHPNISMKNVLSGGYVASRSSHSRGIAVDLTIVELENISNEKPFDPRATYGPCTGDKADRAPDNSVDMGTAFDCFDVKSHTLTDGLSPEQREWRLMLLNAMQKQGFENYHREWWHFTLNQKRRSRFYDFVITDRK